jgi:hypothetical protein
MVTGTILMGAAGRRPAGEEEMREEREGMSPGHLPLLPSLQLLLGVEDGGWE